MSQPIDWHHLWLCVKSFFEFLYFLAGIAVAGAAIYAAKQVKLASDQLKLTKEIADRSAKRESAKLASEHSKYFAEQVVTAYNEAGKAYTAGNSTFLAPVQLPPGIQFAFIIHNGDFGQVHYDLARITKQQWDSCAEKMVMLLNKLEGFAIPFAAGVADDAIGFHETAPVFIGILNWTMPAIWYLRQTQGARYASILKLFNVWNNRVALNALQPFLNGMQRMVAEANNPIPPM